MLQESDQAFLDESGVEYDIRLEGGMVCVVMKNWSLPPGYSPERSDLLLRLPAGFPDVPPDMFWFDPAVSYSQGGVPPASESREAHLGRTWQRFSRHLASGAWHPGRDSLRSYLSLIRRDLQRGVPSTEA